MPAGRYAEAPHSMVSPCSTSRYVVPFTPSSTCTRNVTQMHQEQRTDPPAPDNHEYLELDPQCKKRIEYLIHFVYNDEGV